MEVWWGHGVGGGGHSSWNSGAVEFIARVRLRENELGEMDVLSKQDGGGCWSGLGDRRLADLLRGRWDQIQVEQLGSEGVAVIEADEVVPVLRLRLVGDLKREAKQVLDEHDWRRIEEELFTLQLGSDRAFQQEESMGQSNGP